MRTSVTVAAHSLVPVRLVSLPNEVAAKFISAVRTAGAIIATIEPWHGTEVVVWPEDEAGAR